MLTDHVCFVYQFGKGENSLTVAKFNHSYSNSPAAFKEFNNIRTKQQAIYDSKNGNFNFF